LSSQYGWAANQVVEYEVVLANSTIVRASNSSHSDLFAALRGGGGSFGIVTAFTLRAFPQGKVSLRERMEPSK
jgi:FAD/FMN-containing dehydrogenase